MNGSQAQLNFLPERSTDFIFAVIGEEFGLLGLVVLMLLYLVIVSRAVFLATQASGTFARLLGSSVALTFFVYVFINAGMVTESHSSHLKPSISRAFSANGDCG